jgi:hypothetical protein
MRACPKRPILPFLAIRRAASLLRLVWLDAHKASHEIVKSLALDDRKRKPLGGLFVGVFTRDMRRISPLLNAK